MFSSRKHAGVKKNKIKKKIKETSGDLLLSQKFKKSGKSRPNRDGWQGNRHGSSLDAAMKSPSEGRCNRDFVALPLII